MNALLEISRLHLLSSPESCKENLLTLINESILQGLFKNLIEGNDLETVQLFSKAINTHIDLGILIFYYYIEIIQNEKFLQNISEQKIVALWTLIRSLDDNFVVSFEDLFFGNDIKSLKKKGINGKRSNPYVQESQEEQQNETEAFDKLYKNSRNFFSFIKKNLAFQKLSQNFLKISGLKDEQIEGFLKIFTKKIIPRLENPLLFVDYLMVSIEIVKSSTILVPF